MHSIIDTKNIFRALRFFSRKMNLSYWENKLRYKGLSIGKNVELNILGKFEYQKNVSIGNRSIIIIPEKGTLSIGENCYIGRNCEIGPSTRISVDRHTSIQDRTIILGDVSIGRYCVMAPNIYISSGRHYYKENPYLFIQDQDRSIHENNAKSKLHNRAVTIEDDCWIGINVVIMPGVKIGKGCIIGANSVVTKDIEPYTVAVGTPAKSIDYRLNFFKDMPLNLYGNEETSFPYFYSGIDYSVDTILQYKYAIIDTCKFIVYLNNDKSHRFVNITLETREMDNTVTYLDQIYTTTDGIQNVKFDIGSNLTNIFEFYIENNMHLTKIIKIFLEK